MVPTSSDFWFLPLGGTGEIGMNMNLYGHAGQWLMVDCGVSFDEPLNPDDAGVVKHDVVAPDPTLLLITSTYLPALSSPMRTRIILARLRIYGRV